MGSNFLSHFCISTLKRNGDNIFIIFFFNIRITQTDLMRWIFRDLIDFIFYFSIYLVVILPLVTFYHLKFQSFVSCQPAQFISAFWKVLNYQMIVSNFALICLLTQKGSSCTMPEEEEVFRLILLVERDTDGFPFFINHVLYL